MRDQYLNLLRVKLNITDYQEDIFVSVMEIAERQLAEYQLSFKDIYDCLVSDGLSVQYRDLFNMLAPTGIAVYSTLYGEVDVMIKATAGVYSEWSYSSINAYNKGTIILVDVSPTVRFTVGPNFTHVDPNVSDLQSTYHDITDLVDSFKDIPFQDLIYDPNFKLQLELCLGHNFLD